MKPEAHPAPGANLYAVGKLTGCFGIKGYIKLQPITGMPERFRTLRKAHVGSTAGNTEVYEVQSVDANNKGMVIKFEKVDDRTSAEQLIGRFVFVDEEHLERPKTGSYFVHDLIGCEVVSTDGRSIGSVSEVYHLPGQDLWEIRHGSDTTLMPAVKKFIRDVDLKKRRITIQLIEGLFGPGDTTE